MWFEATNELKINFLKNKLIRGVNVEMLPTTYFRLPLVVSYKSIVIWDMVEETPKKIGNKENIFLKKEDSLQLRVLCQVYQFTKYHFLLF